MKSAALVTAMACVLGACTVSVKGPEQPADPLGEPAAVMLESGAVLNGELLAVTDAELVLKEANGTLAAVALSAAKQVRLERYETTVAGRWREGLALYCRYPQGLNDAQWQQLLRQAGQSAFVRIPP